VLADVKKRFPVDEDRVYLTGLSMGGGGTLWLGLTRPDVWAAIAPVCAAAPRGATELAPNALQLPVHLFHGDLDPVVPVEGSREWHKRLLQSGARAEYIEYPGVRHNSWDNAYKNAAIFDWFARHRRNRYPERVRFVTRQYRYNSAYWVHLDGFTPGQLASVDVRFTGRNQLAAETANLDGFTLNLDGHPLSEPGKPVAVTVDGSRVQASAQGPFSFHRTAQGWRAGRWVPAPADKRPGAEGPLAEAVASRHLYVYGTADSPSPDELRRRREQAAHAADWTGLRARLLLNLRVAADKDVREADLRGANLVLFGTRETNSLIARHGDQLPLELNAGAADYGLVFVAHAGGRYLLVSSGLPWWTGADQVKRGGFRFLPGAFAVLLTMGDFLLFKGSLENVVAEGLFDGHWKTPAVDAARIAATGAVRVRP